MLRSEVAVIPMKNVEIILGSLHIKDAPLPVFSNEAVEFISDLSSALIKSNQAKVFPDLYSLAFFTRKANLKRIATNFGDKSGVLGRGVCVHIAPSNIPANFAFSFIFALLAGNASIVRLHSKDFKQNELFCAVMKSVLQKHPEVASRVSFVRYQRDDEITAKLSLQADCRMIWGGDSTVAKLKSMPTQPRCVDICFPDRYSIMIIDANEVLKASDEELMKLSRNFYNDTWLMDQNACSSPQLILWLNDNRKARERFWKTNFIFAKSKYNLQDETAVDKYTLMCSEAISNPQSGNITRKENLLYTEEIKALTLDITEHRGHGGYFFEHALSSFDELSSVITQRYQTVTYYGIDRDFLRNEIIRRNLRGVDRIVPVGKALDIGPIWDGHDLIRELSRKISFE